MSFFFNFPYDFWAGGKKNTHTQNARVNLKRPPPPPKIDVADRFHSTKWCIPTLAPFLLIIRYSANIVSLFFFFLFFFFFFFFFAGPSSEEKKAKRERGCRLDEKKTFLKEPLLVVILMVGS